MSPALSEKQMLTRAALAVGKVDRYGARGITLVNMQEIEAMAATLVCLGLKPLHPDQKLPDEFFIEYEGERP